MESWDLVEAHDVCRLCLTLCGREGKAMHNKCHRKKQLSGQEQLCQKLNKCRRGHNMLLHVNAEGQRDLPTAKADKLVQPPDGPTRSQAYDDTQLAVGDSVRGHVMDEPDAGEAGPLPWTQEMGFSDMLMASEGYQLGREGWISCLGI
jgi:hypothetical protein